MDALKALMTALKTLMVANTYAGSLYVSKPDYTYLHILNDMSWNAYGAYYDRFPNEELPFGEALVNTIFAFHDFVNATEVKLANNPSETIGSLIHNESSYANNVWLYNARFEEDSPSADDVITPSIFSEETTLEFDRMCAVFAKKEQ